jgi:TP901 family phage tail tape measure protein
MADDLLGTLGEAIVLLRADGETLNADLKKRKKELEKELESWEQSFKSIGKGLSATVTPAILAIGAAAVGAGLEIDEALDNIRIKTGATGEAAKSLQDSFQNVFANVPVSANEVSDALATLYQRTGLTGQGLEELAEKNLNLARITKNDLNTTLQTSQDLFANWGVTAADQGNKLDFLFNVSQKTGVSITTLMQNLTSSGSALREFGFGLEESAALLGQMEKAGISSEAMLGGLRKAASSFAKDGVDLKIGLQATIEEIKQLGPGLASTQKALDVFGTKVGTQVADAIHKGKLGVKEFYDQLRNSPDTITKAAGETDGFSEKLKIFRNNATLALEPLGTKLLDIANRAMPMLVALAKHAESAADQFGNLPEPIQDAAVALGGMAALSGPVLYFIGGMISQVGSLATIFQQWGKYITLAGAGMAGLATVTAGLSLYKLVEAGGLVIDILNNKKQASKDAASQIEMDQRAIALVFEKTGVRVSKASDAYELLRLYSAGLRGETVKLTTAFIEDRIAYEAGIEAGKKLTTTVKGQERAQIDAAKAAMEEAERQRRAAAAKAEAAEKAKQLREEMEKLTATYSGKTALEEANKLITVLGSIGGVSKLSKADMETMFPVFENVISKLSAMGQEVPPKIRQVYQELFRLLKLPEAAKDSYSIWEQGLKETLDRQQQMLVEAQNKRNEAILKGFDFAADQMKKARQAGMSEQDRMLDDAATFRDEAYKQIEPLKDSFPEIWQQARDAINKIYDGMVKDANNAGNKTAVAFGKKLGTAIVGAFQQGGGGDKIGGAIGSFIGNEVGAKAGEALGSMATKAISGVAGKAIGGVIGGAIGSVIPVVGTILGGMAGKWIGGLFGGGEKKKVQEAREELIKNAGGLDALKAKADAAGVSLDKMLNTKKMDEFNKEVEKLNRAFTDYDKKIKGISTAISGVNTLGQGLTAQLQRVMDEQDKIFESKNKGKEIDDLTARVYQGTEEQRQAWERLGQFTLATFAEQVRITGDIIGTLQQMEPAFESISSAQEKFGFEGSESMNRLLGLYRTVKDNADVFTSLSGVSQIMKGLGDAMAVNQDLALAFGQELAANFKTLTDRGVDTTMALALMQPQLQQLWELQREGKLVTDEATQALLDQAEAQGIVGEEMRDVNEKILDVLLAIGKALGADIPAGLRNLENAARNTKIPPIEIPYVYTPTNGLPEVTYPEYGRDPYLNINPETGIPNSWQDPVMLDDGGFGNWGMGTPAVLHGAEAVIPMDRFEAMMASSTPAFDPAELVRAMIESGAVGGDIYNIEPHFNGTLANEARGMMRDYFLPLLISVLRDSNGQREELFSLAPTRR